MEPWLFHPVFVHFAVALLFTASVLCIAAALSRGKPWVSACLNAARWNFWLGIIMAACTAVTGLLAYFTVPGIDETTRLAINKHFISALVTVTAYLVLSFFLWRRQRKKLLPSNTWTTALVLAIALLTCTAYLGGDLVFKRGVGVTFVASANAR
jgi:uncharacterized membrane protein